MKSILQMLQEDKNINDEFKNVLKGKNDNGTNKRTNARKSKVK